jgi:hypothetical protein
MESGLSQLFLKRGGKALTVTEAGSKGIRCELPTLTSPAPQRIEQTR